MDVLLPSDEVMKKMAEEYARMLDDGRPRAQALECAPLPSSRERSGCCSLGFPAFFALYFAFALGYNFGYGNAVAYADGNMGGVQSRKGEHGDLDCFFPRKR